MPKRTDFKFCFKQEATAAGGTKHLLYIYDSVRKRGDFNETDINPPAELGRLPERGAINGV